MRNIVPKTAIPVAAPATPTLHHAATHLPISGCSGEASSISSLALGGQIVSLMLLGGGSAFLFGFCIFFGIESPKQARWKYLLAAVPCAVLVFFFYGWARFGHPLVFFGLR